MFNILVCEDERDLRELYCTVLRAEGFSAACASDGAQALEMLERENGRFFSSLSSNRSLLKPLFFAASMA